jgi:hypothetical protein
VAHAEAEYKFKIRSIMSADTIAGNCPNCKTAIKTTQKVAWCPGCYKELPTIIREKLPSQIKETAPGEPVLKPTTVNQGESAMPGLDIIAGILIVGAAIAIAYGIYRMYAYGYDDKVVGGDAYNYTIHATRGVGWICVGVGCAVAACFLALISIRKTIKISK